MYRTSLTLGAFLALAVGVSAAFAPAARAVETTPVDPDALAKQMDAMTRDVTQGALRVVKKGGEVVECPLKHTDVKADVSGFIARVKVTQTFFNPLDEKIEAVYVFPLPHKAAVDDMTMVIGQRKIVGLIKRRAEARRIYEAALAQGMTAALLEQERPNIFTQSVGNIEPKQEIRIEISYVDVLEYDMGVYEFHFPMVVGPRYIPGSATSTIAPVGPELQGKVGELDKGKVSEGPDKPKGPGWSPDTNRVPDASRITPPVLKPGVRNGHDISLEVTLDAGVPIQDLKVTSHEAAIQRTGKSQARVKLSDADTVPNKSFVLRYGVVGKLPEMAVLTHTDARGLGYFMLMVQPADDERVRESPPREMVFMVDVSGSMSGPPTAKNIEAMGTFLKLCRPTDTVQVITFESQSQKLFDKPVPVTEENIQKALKFTDGLKGGGGTEMLKGIRMALDEPADPDRVRIVLLMSDGYIGNEAEIIAEVGRRAGDRVRFWAIGIGSEPNRFLLDGVARQGGGMSKTLGLKDDPTPLVQEVMFRIQRAQLANVQINWGALKVYETYPAKTPELWAGRPIVLFGLYDGGGREETITITGNVEGKAVSWPLRVMLPANEQRNEVLSKVWARHKIEDLMQQTFYAGSPEVEEAVTSIALEYRLMSQYTSFVAVDEKDVGTLREPARPPRRMVVAVPLPEGTRFEGFFGGEGEALDELAVMNGAVAGKAQSRFSVSAGFVGYSGTVASNALSKAAASPAPVAMMPATPAPAPMAALRPAKQARGSMLSVSGGALQAGRSGGRMSPGAYANFDAAALSVALTDKSFGDFDGDVGYTGQALMQDAQAAAKRAQEVLKEAQELQKKGDLAAARAKFTAAYFLNAAAYYQTDASVSAAALAGIEETSETLAKDWAKAMPGLQKRLDLVIRDKSVADALDEIAGAAGLRIRLMPGSVEDAAAILGRKDLRVTYLDLRGATATEALDWLLTPARLAWWVEGSAVVAGTVRRGPGESAWVYDVAALALPSAKDLEAIKDEGKRLEAATKAGREFLAAVRKGAGAKDAAVGWYAPGQMLVIGDAALHAATAKLLADLADPTAKLDGDLATLQAMTIKRAEGRKDALAAMMAAGEKHRVLEAMTEFSWRLLASAARGEVDPEALTELQIVWRHPAVADLFKGPAGAAVARSLWAVNEAARAVPGDGKLAALAKETSRAADPVLDSALTAFEKSPESPAAFFKVLYLVLAGKDGDFAAKARTLLAPTGKTDSPVAVARIVAAPLLAPAKEADAKALVGVLPSGAVRGNDMVTLAALASRRTGGATWEKFRAEAQTILGNQPLDGSVIVLVNRLAAPKAALASAKSLSE